jgi:hypothetical protein
MQVRNPEMHADYRMKGPCKICQEMQFIGTCPHGMAERIYPAPRITPEEIKDALEKALPGAIELDEKLKEMFRPLLPGENTERYRAWLGDEAKKRQSQWKAHAEKAKKEVMEMLDEAKDALADSDFETATRLIIQANRAMIEITYEWWMDFKPPARSVLK